MIWKKSFIYIFFAIFLLLTVSASADTFLVQMDTMPMSGDFSLGFDLTSGFTSGNNTVTLSDFSATGGSMLNSPSSRSLSDTDFFTSVNFAFTPGTKGLSFLLDVTNNPDEFNPDQLAIYLFDGGSTLPITTSDELANALIVIDLGVGSTVSPQLFEGTGNYAGVTASISSVPEPGSIVLISIAGPLVALRRKRRMLQQ